MSAYDSKSCSTLAKLYYKPIEAALRWCGLIEHEARILKETGAELFPPMTAFPQWPCLRLNAEKIYDAIQNKELPHGRDGRTVAEGDHVAKARITVRHTDLKIWMEKHEPGQKPPFLFDEIERSTHASINADSFRALQEELNKTNERLQNGIAAYKTLQNEKNDIAKERDSLRAQLDALLSAPDKELSARERNSLLRTIAGLVTLMLGETDSGKKHSVFESQAAIITALEAHFPNKEGIKKNTLEQKIAEGKNLLDN